MELSYSFHLGNDKNKSFKSRQQSKNTLSGTTNKSNNAIQNVKQLGKVNHHNLRQYDNNQELIKTIKGTNDIVKDVKDLYLNLFEEPKKEYNDKQIRDDRKIDNYFNKISNDTKHDLACEIVIELGDISYWEYKTKEYKYKMVDVFKKQIEDLKEIVPDFHIANATVHFDEHSPHLHIIGVPVKDNCKTGMKKQVGKTSIFTKESLVIIQDKMREKCIKEFNQVYQLNDKLKDKQKGKNKDYTAYERLKFNEKNTELKKELSNLRNEISNMEYNKDSINKEINKLNKDKKNITEEITEKKNISNKIIIKSKNKLEYENEKLLKENNYLKSLSYQTETKYKELKEKTDYLIHHLNKEIDKQPLFIKKIVENLFNYENIQLEFFKRQYDPEIKEKEMKRYNNHKSAFSIFNSKEIERATKNINKEMDKSAEEFYTKKEKDSDYSR